MAGVARPIARPGVCNGRWKLLVGRSVEADVGPDHGSCQPFILELGS